MANVTPIRKILIANRGEIARRIIRTAKDMGIATVAIYSETDAFAPFVLEADAAIALSGTTPAETYLDTEKVLEACRMSGADALHPGYGFLSENTGFAQAIQAAGMIFIGPSTTAIDQMGDKLSAKALMQAAGVPTLPAIALTGAEDLAAAGESIGYPVLVKASAGGGGRGMRVVETPEALAAAVASAQREAGSAFGDDTVFLERWLSTSRHVEIQILGDQLGHVVHCFERECSIQRRNQKVIEEAPSPFLTPEVRQAMGAQSCALAQAVGYTSAGTVEFIVDSAQNFYFLEMNTRLQVEHPVTELITGVDLVEQMIRVANGEALSISQEDVKINGWALESRLYAEDPYRGFLPSIGRLTRYRPPAESRSVTAAVRNDTGVYEGGEISMFYDPMIAKLCTWAPDRPAAIAQMRNALDAFEVEGIGHNIPFLSAVMDHPKFCAGNITTAFIEEEYPDGFHGVDLPEETLKIVGACAAAMYRLGEIRRTKVSGRMDNHERRVRDDWVVGIQHHEFPVTIAADPNGSTVHFESGSHRVASDWTPGKPLALMNVDGVDIALKVEKCTSGYRIRFRGADMRVTVRSPRQAELAQLMIEKVAPDTSKLLLCPMPGLIVKVDVAVGDEVQEGQTLCTVEAMKMENILRAEKKAVVSKIHAAPGDSLAVDAIIMEFE